MCILPRAECGCACEERAATCGQHQSDPGIFDDEQPIGDSNSTRLDGFPGAPWKADGPQREEKTPGNWFVTW
jgi:hypothetical protein